MRNKPFNIAGEVVNPGEHKTLALPASLYTQTPVNIPVHVFHGKEKGPRLFLIGALHGDEINGVEIIRLLLSRCSFKKLRGTLILIPVANVHGLVTLSRYLPDRRDLNRSFPGSSTGSLAARLANLFMEEIISRCTHGIDFHTGSAHLENLPHIRTTFKLHGALSMANAFNAPVILDAKVRDGSLRQAATELKIPVLVYEGGEALRFNDLTIRIGFRGVLNVLNWLEMITTKRFLRQKRITTRIAYYSGWIRSPESGIVHFTKLLGQFVKKNEALGIIADPFAKKEVRILSPVEGLIIGRNKLPLVNEGDALFHIAKFEGRRRKITSELIQLENYLDHPWGFF